MCQASVVEFVEGYLGRIDLTGKTVLEVGSYDRNGSMRKHIEAMGCKSYHGVDLEMGPSVDEICDATDVLSKFGEDAFDVVICTEVVEHVRDWRETMRNLKGVTKPGGLLVVTTRSQGFEYHAFPTDFWRYELEDFEAIFADFDIKLLESDPGPAGVFVAAEKPNMPRAVTDLSAINLYCIIVGERVDDFTPAQHRAWRTEWFFRRVLGKLNPARKEHWTRVT